MDNISGFNGSVTIYYVCDVKKRKKIIRQTYIICTYYIMTMTIANPPFTKVKFVLFNIVVTIGSRFVYNYKE